MKIYLAKSQIQLRSATYVITQINFIIGLNPKFIRNGFSVVKNVGILFRNIMTIPMVGQESQNDKEWESLISNLMRLVEAWNLTEVNQIGDWQIIMI